MSYCDLCIGLSSHIKCESGHRASFLGLSEFRATAAHLDGDADFYVVVDSTVSLILATVV